MTISVVIPTLNFASGIERTLENIKRQSVPISEILVVDSSSDDGTAELARAAGARVIVVAREAFDHGGTRSLAAKATTGDILVFLTQDAVLADTEAITRLILPFSAGVKVGCAFGRQVPHPDADVFGRALRFFNYPDRPHLRTFRDKAEYGFKTVFISNSFAAYSRRALEEIGWFKAGLILGEDACAGGRMLMADYGIAYAAEAVVEHSHNYTALQDFKRYFDIGVFHREERWLLDTFGKAEGEGLKFILSGLRFLKENEAALLIPEFFLRSGLKYLGYKFGYFHRYLPQPVSKRLSMHSAWWGKGRTQAPGSVRPFTP